MPWTIIIPVKGFAGAKSRFAPGDNRALARAMALDTVEVALQVAPVIVVTTDGAPFEELGARVVSDPREGLNAAIATGVAAARESGDRPTAVLLGDHPALTAEELRDALAAAEGHERALVADSEGTGSALTASRGIHDPQFGVDSAAKHVASGYTPLDGDWPGLRRDIDTADQLAALAHTGPRTAQIRASIPAQNL